MPASEIIPDRSIILRKACVQSKLGNNLKKKAGGLPLALADSLITALEIKTSANFRLMLQQKGAKT